jgi:hypothetical protein
VVNTESPSNKQKQSANPAVGGVTSVKSALNIFVICFYGDNTAPGKDILGEHVKGLAIEISLLNHTDSFNSNLTPADAREVAMLVIFKTNVAIAFRMRCLCFSGECNILKSMFLIINFTVICP